MIDTILKGGSSFDWISPVWAFIQDLRNGPAVGFTVPMEAGASTEQLQALLKERGVKVWGIMMVDDTILFTVRKAQARYVHYLFDRAGIPYQGGLGDALALVQRNAQGKPRKKSASGWLDNCLDGVEQLIDRL